MPRNHPKCGSAILLLALVLSACGQDRETWRARADASLAAGDYRAAIIDLRNLIRSTPDDAPLRVQYSRALLATGDPETGAAELRKARELGADDGQVAPLLAEAHLALGAFADVLTECDTASQAGSPGADVPRLRGYALLGLRRYSEAKAALTEALELDPGDLEARIGLARVVGELEGSEAERRELDRALAIAPEVVEVRLASGGWYMNARQYARARDEFADAFALVENTDRRRFQVISLAALGLSQLALEAMADAAATHAKLRQIAPGTHAELLLAARVAARQGRLEDAQMLLQQLLNQKDRSPAANLLMGAVTFGQGKFGLAEMYLTSALSADPENLPARKLLAEVQLRQRKAQRVLESIEGAGPQVDADLLSAAGRASVLLGNLDAAIAYFERSSKADPEDHARALDLAAAYLNAKRPAQALEVLDRLRDDERTLHRRELMRVTALVQSGRVAEATTTAQAFAGARPRDARALLMSARALAIAGDERGARGMLERLIELDPKDAASWVALGAFEWVSGNLAQADTAFAEALTRNAVHLDALVGKAEVARARGDAVEALARLEEARKAHATAVAPRVALARLYVELRDVTRAETVVKEALDLSPGNPLARVVQAEAAIVARRIPDAISSYEALARDFPTELRVRVGLARVYVLAGRPADARRAAAGALEIDPSYWPALTLAASTAIQDGDLGGAAAMLARVHKTEAPEVLVKSLEGDLAMGHEAYTQAAQHYGAARRKTSAWILAVREFEALRLAGDRAASRPLEDWLREHPADHRVRFVLAQHLQATGAHDTAESEYRAILAANAKDAPALNNLAWIRLEAGDFPGALELAARAYESARNNPAIADTYGWALVRAGRAAEAVPILRAAHAGAGSAEVRVHLASALAAAGEKAEARRHLEDIVGQQDAADQHDFARDLLERLDRETAAPDVAPGA